MIERKKKGKTYWYCNNNQPGPGYLVRERGDKLK